MSVDRILQIVSNRIIKFRNIKYLKHVLIYNKKTLIIQMEVFIALN